MSLCVQTCDYSMIFELIFSVYSLDIQHQFITVCADNCIVLWHISMDSSSNEGPVLQATNSFNMNTEGLV